MSFGLSELMDNGVNEENLDYYPEIFRALENFMGGEESYVDRPPHTPSMSMQLHNLWSQESMSQLDNGNYDTTYNSTNMNYNTNNNNNNKNGEISYDLSND